ncbi:hypothetical protein QX776_04315 [Alteromonadaceae bacterium BrNp21-10]|nr:hypothetical protein [Alteromonadaceae bacterium BrNp21-10]
MNKRLVSCLTVMCLLTVNCVLAVSNIDDSTQATTPSMLGKFDTSKDLLLSQFDSKTDVDDIHTIAAVATMLRDPQFANVNYHGVAGAYGIQEGLYVPAPELFALAFGDNWSNAHTQRDKALAKVISLVQSTLEKGGDIWIAEAGQSDFSADMLKAIQLSHTDIDTKQRIHIVQHSDWNENSTSPDDLSYVQQHSDYHKIADGNATGNGTPGFRNEDASDWTTALTHYNAGPLWKMAKQIGEKYNGKDGRYNNTAVESGGLDFSDAAEMCWIFGYLDIKNTRDFFSTFTGK